MILLQLLAELVEDVKGDMSKGQAGTGTTLFHKTQTALVTAIAAWLPFFLAMMSGPKKKNFHCLT